MTRRAWMLCVMPLMAILAACGDSTAPPADPPGPTPVVLQVASGNQQSGIAGRALADSLEVRVLTAAGAAMPGAAIAWAASSGALSSATTVTDASGRARVQWIVGTGSGSATASASGSSPATFVATGRANGQCVLTPSSATQRFSLGPTDFTLSLRATSALRIAVLFVDFPDAAASETPASLMSSAVDPGFAMMRELSYNRIDISATAFPTWYRMSKSIGSYTWSTYAGHRDYIMEAMRLADGDVDFSQFNAVYIFAARSPVQRNSPTFNGGTSSGVVFDGRNFGNAVTFGNDARTWGPAIVAHETGHMLGLLDLYAYDPAGGTTYAGNQFKHTGAWSLMSNVFNPAHYLAWEKRKLGFLDESQVDCLEAGGIEAVIQPNSIVGGVKLIAVPLDASRVLAIEVRSGQGLDANLCAFGVLIYEVNATAPSGTGAVQIRGSRATTSGAAFSKCGPWADGVYNLDAGGTRSFTDASGVTVSVVAAEPNGAFRVRVKKP